MSKIFISHRSLDKKIADVFETFLTTSGFSFDDVFCSSLPGNDIKLDISNEIKAAIQSSVVNIVILSNSYYKSPYCQNEAGIIWFLDTTKIVIALPEINDTLMEGFLNSGNKIRRLDSQSDILAICDIIGKQLGGIIVSHQKLNANVERLIQDYSVAVKNRKIEIDDIQKPFDNKLENEIISYKFSDEEMLILLYFYKTGNLFMSDDCIEINLWMTKNNIIGYINIRTGLELLVEAKHIEIITSQVRVVLSTYRELQKISKTALEFMEAVVSKYKDNEIKGCNENPIDTLIEKGFNESELLLIKYIKDLERTNLFCGWQMENETNMIKNWEEINGIENILSQSYRDAIIKFEIRKYIEQFALTSSGNPKEYKIKETFLNSINALNDHSMKKINDLIGKLKQNDDTDLPF